MLYAKHMAKHRVGIERTLVGRGAHMLLVRERTAVIQSFAEVLEPTLQETCYPALLEIYSELRAAGCAPPHNYGLLSRRLTLSKARCSDWIAAVTQAELPIMTFCLAWMGAS